MSDEFYCSYDADSTTLSIGGPLDADTVGALEQFIDKGNLVRVVDCTQVTLLAAAGVAALLRVGDTGSLTLLPSHAALRTLRICGLDQHFGSGSITDAS